MSIHNSLTNGPIAKQIIYFSFPLLLGNLFQQLYNTVDSVIIGNYVGNEALAAINSSTPIINLIISLFMGIAIGAGVIISRCYGANNIEKLQKTIHTTIALSLVTGILLTILGVILTPTILKAVGTPMNVLQPASTYLRIYFYGVLAVLIYNMGSGILRSVGDSKFPLYYLIVSSIINIILDFVFVVIIPMGIQGVAWATLIAQTISALLVLYTLSHRSSTYQLHFRQLKFHKTILFEIIKIGFPSGIQNAIVSFSNVIVQSNINAFGSLAMAGCGSYTKIDGFAILPVMSFSMALTTFVSQNIGAQQYDRVLKGTKIGLWMCTSIIAGIALLLFLFAEPVLSIFSKDAQVIHYGTLMMRSVLPGYITLAISHSLAGVIRGAGLTKIPMMVMILCWCILRISWIQIGLSMMHNIQIVFWAYPISWSASAIIMYLYYKKAKWLPSK